MKGSVHEDDIFSDHDALALMTAKETIQNEIQFINTEGNRPRNEAYM